MNRFRLGDEGQHDKNLQYKEFDGGTVAETFAKASAWLARNDGAIGVLDVALHYLNDPNQTRAE